jgi:type II secretory pathway component PulF
MDDPTEPNQPRGKLSRDEVSRFSEQLAGLTSAGLQLGPGLRATAAELPLGRLRSTLESVARAIDSGASVEEAVAGQGNRVPAHLRDLILIGSKTGRVGQVLAKFVGFRHVGEELRRKLWVSLAYPVFLLAGAVALFSFVMANLVSTFGTIFRDFGVPIPGITVLLIGLSRVFEKGNRPITEVAVGIVTLWLFSRFVLSGPVRRSIVAGVPLVGQVWRNTSMAEFCHLLALMIECDVPLPESVTLAGSGVGDASIDRACRALGQDVRGGMSLSEAIVRQPVFPKGLAPLLRWAEGHEGLPGSLHMAGEMFESRARAQATFAGTVIGVLAWITIVAGITWIVVGLIFPLITLISRLSG